MFNVIQEVVWHYEIGAITSEWLEGKDVLVLTNRVTQGYLTGEHKAIITFAHAGIGLWSMANHATSSGNSIGDQMKNHVGYDYAVTTTFMTSYQAAAFQ